MSPEDRAMLEEERELLLNTIRLLGARGEETGTSDKFFLMLGVNAWRLSLSTPMPASVREQVREGIHVVRRSWRAASGTASS